METKTSIKSPFLKNVLDFLYLFFLLITILFSGYSLILDIMEVVYRSLGRYTALSEMSWMSDKQAILYSIGWATIFLTILIILFDKLFKNKRKIVIIICILLFALAIAQIYIESFLLYPAI